MNSELQAGLLLTAVELIGDYGAKIGNPIICYGGYAVLATTLMRTLQYGTLTLVNANWDACSNLATMALGYALGERFTQSQYLGLVLVSAGLFLINNNKVVY